MLTNCETPCFHLIFTLISDPSSISDPNGTQLLLPEKSACRALLIKHISLAISPLFVITSIAKICHFPHFKIGRTRGFAAAAEDRLTGRPPRKRDERKDGFAVFSFFIGNSAGKVARKAVEK